MPKGIYQHRRLSEETKNKISRAMKGKVKSENCRKKLSEAGKGERNHNWKDGRWAGSNPIIRKKMMAFYERLRYYKKKNNNGLHTLGEWENLKAQYNWICPACGKQEPEIKLTEDHIVPLTKGGSNNIENIQPLCKSCNSRKHTKIIKYEGREALKK